MAYFILLQYTLRPIPIRCAIHLPNRLGPMRVAWCVSASLHSATGATRRYCHLANNATSGILSLTYCSMDPIFSHYTLPFLCRWRFCIWHWPKRALSYGGSRRVPFYIRFHRAVFLGSVSVAPALGRVAVLHACRLPLQPVTHTPSQFLFSLLSEYRFSLSLPVCGHQRGVIKS